MRKLFLSGIGPEGVYMDKLQELEMKLRMHEWWEMLLLFFAHGKEYEDPMLRSINGLRDADAARLWLGTIGRSVNVPNIFRNEVRVQFVKVTTEPVQDQGLVTTKTELTLYALPKKALQTPTQLAWNVVFVDASGNEILFNPSGMAQKGDWLYYIDNDRPQLIIQGANEINGLVEGEHIRLEHDPVDLTVVAGLAPNMRGEAVGAGTGPDGTDYLFALFSQPKTPEAEECFPSVLVRMITDKEDSSLMFNAKTPTDGNGMGLNTPEFLIVPLETGAKHIVVPGYGGKQYAGASNGEDSTIFSIPAFEPSWASAQRMLLRGNENTGRPIDLDISGLCGDLGVNNNGRMLVQTGRYDPAYRGYTHCLYETTKALLLNAPGCTLEEAVALGILSVTDGFSGCYADVEHVAVNGKRALIMPAHEVPGDVRRVKAAGEGSGEAESERSIVRPCAGRLVMGAVAPHTGDLKTAPGSEFHRNTERVSRGKTKQEGGYLVYQSFIAHSAAS
jgi:hypothetical protein